MIKNSRLAKINLTLKAVGVGRKTINERSVLESVKPFTHGG